MYSSSTRAHELLNLWQTLSELILKLNLRFTFTDDYFYMFTFTNKTHHLFPANSTQNLVSILTVHPGSTPW